MLSKNQIKEIQALQLKKHRDARQLFIAEGVKSVMEIVRGRAELVDELFATPHFIESQRLILAPLSINITSITETELSRISLQQTPNQVLAICRYLPDAAQTVDPEKEFTLYLDEIRDPGNFGTLLRLADWFGMSTLFCSPNSCDLYNPKVIQASMGAFLRVQVMYSELDKLKRSMGTEIIYGAVLNGKDLYAQPLRHGLIVIGNEANGIRESNLPFINHPITIPAHRSNGTESLNAAVAASIIVSEFFRQLKHS